MSDEKEKVTSSDIEEICQKMIPLIKEQCNLIADIKYEVHMPDRKMLLAPCVVFEFFLSALNATMPTYKIVCFFSEDSVKQFKNYEFMRGFVLGITDDIYEYYERIKKVDV